MSKVTFKIPKKAFEAASDRGDFEQPPPNVYIAKLTSCEPYFAKKDGKDDKTRPSLECIYSIIGVGQDGEKPEVRYSQLWDYVSMKPGEDTDWKRAQFATAMGLADGATAFTGAVETKELVGTVVKLRVKKDTDNAGNYRGKVGFVGPYGGDEPDAFADDEEGGTAEEEEPFAEEDPAEADDSLYTEEDLAAMDRDEFKALCDQYEIPVKGKKKSDLIGSVLEAQTAAVDAEATGDGDDEEPF